MPRVPYVIFPFDEIQTLVAELCPSGDLTELHERIEPQAERIKRLPLDHPERQLLALLRLRASCLPSDWYGAPVRLNDLRYWCLIQSSCPLSA
jgi:hypothetical protein